MPRLSRADRDCIRDVVDELRVVRLDDGDAWIRLLERLRSHSDGQMTTVYRVAYPAERLEVEFVHDTNGGRVDTAFGVDLRRYVHDLGQSSVLYDPVRPDPKQRNVVLNPYDALLKGSDQEAAPAIQVLAERQAFDVDGQIRTLLCDGPVLLGYFGGAWAKENRRRATQLLNAIAPAVHERLLADRALGHAPVLSAALRATLEALAVPAFITRCCAGRVNVELTNAAGALELDRPGSRVREDLAAAILTGAGSSRFGVQALVAAGLPAYHLVTETRPARPLSKVATATRRFGLTPRQRDVLEVLILGHTNRTISELLRCAESTVELHVSALFEKTGSETRSQLVARVWMLGED